VKKLGFVIFKLKLSKIIKIYSVFYVALLEPVPRNAKLESVDIDEKIKKLLYEIKKIKGY
jgi:hypothetical protein